MLLKRNKISIFQFFNISIFQFFNYSIFQFYFPDTRDPHCRAATYDDVLPKASIIIIFTNEAWSPLIRTIWSVLDNTEAEHLHEIILVDDFSDKTHLKGKLTRYIQKKFTSKVKLLRLKSRLVQFNHKPIIFVCCLL